MDIFDSTPKEKFFDILLNANRSVVESELEKLFCEFVALSELSRNLGVTNSDILSFLAQNPEIIENGLNDIYIGKMGDILSQNE